MYYNHSAREERNAMKNALLIPNKNAQTIRPYYPRREKNMMMTMMLKPFKT